MASLSEQASETCSGALMSCQARITSAANTRGASSMISAVGSLGGVLLKIYPNPRTDGPSRSSLDPVLSKLFLPLLPLGILWLKYCWKSIPLSFFPAQPHFRNPQAFSPPQHPILNTASVAETFPTVTGPARAGAAQRRIPPTADSGPSHQRKFQTVGNVLKFIAFVFAKYIHRFHSPPT